MSAPQAVVKMVRNGGTRSPAATRRQFDYLSQGGAVALEYPDGDGGPEATLLPRDFREKAEEWALRTDKYEPGQRIDNSSPALTTHIVVSFPPGTDANLAKSVARNFAARMFDDPRRRSNFPADAEEIHRFPYFVAPHTDRDHPHMHLVVNRRSSEGGWLKIANRMGERSDPDVPDQFTFSDLRHELVEAAIEEGMDLEATTRAERGLVPAQMNDIEYRRMMEDSHARWRQEAGSGGDDFIRVENEIDEDGNAVGELAELDRGHTPAPEWPELPELGPLDNLYRPAGPAGDGSPAPAGYDHEEAAMVHGHEEVDPFAPDGEAAGDGDTPMNDAAGGSGRARSGQHEQPGRHERQGDRPAPAGRANEMREDDEAGEDRDRREALRRTADGAREMAAHRRHQSRRVDAVQARPSRRRTPAGVEDIEDDAAEAGEVQGGAAEVEQGDAPAPAGPAVPAERNGARPRRRAQFGPPNVATRGIGASEANVTGALRRWEDAEASLENGPVTRSKRQAATEARDAWLRAEQDAQAARANPGRKRKRGDDPAAGNKRTCAEARQDAGPARETAQNAGERPAAGRNRRRNGGDNRPQRGSRER